jgi:hypothetical protein
MFNSSFATINGATSDVSLNTVFNSGSEIVWGDQRIANEDKERKKREKEEEQELRKQRIEEYKKKSKKIRVEYERRLMDYIEIHGNYWQHPQIENCYIPITRRSVPSLDKVNTISIWLQDNGEYMTPMTLVGRIGGEDWTKEEYCELYCREEIEDGVTKYYFEN